MRRSSEVWVIVAIVAATMVAAIALSVGTREQTTVLPPVDVDSSALEPGTGVVVAKAATGGFELFGMRIGTRRHHVDVHFVTSPDCTLSDLDAGEWPVSTDRCAGGPDLSGAIVGSGRSREGATTVLVRTEVSRECFNAVDLGASWPMELVICN